MVTKMTGNLVTAYNGVNGTGTAVGPYDGNWAWELWYKFQVTDNISVTPGIFYLSNPLGSNTYGVVGDNGVAGNAAFFNSFGYLVKTTFKF